MSDETFWVILIISLILVSATTAYIVTEGQKRGESSILSQLPENYFKYSVYCSQYNNENYTFYFVDTLQSYKRTPVGDSFIRENSTKYVICARANYGVIFDPDKFQPAIAYSPFPKPKP